MPADPSGSSPTTSNGFVATPEQAHFHFGDESRLRVAAESVPTAEPVAVLVCHGMGQQVRFETIGQLAASILTHARAAGCTIEPNGVQLSYHEKAFLARVELNWTDDGHPHQVHIYEAYWAPITAGKVTYPETLQFLLQAAWRGFRCSRWFRKTTFGRWMFDGLQEASISGLTKISLVVIALVLLVEAGSIAFVTLRVAAGIKEVSSMVWPAIHQTSLVSLLGFLWRDFLQVLKPFVPQHTILHHPHDPGQWMRAAAKTIAWFGLIGQAFFVRYFLIEYAGDVAAYISPFKDSKFDSIRTEIQAVGLNVARVIYGFDGVRGVPRYERIVVAGHSLGSVLAYDTLNAVINLDLTSATPGSQEAVARTTHLVTFGSPLDKTAFLFRNQSNHVPDPIREQMAAGFQPLIRSYDQFRTRLKWINLWSKMDIISGALVYYDVLPATDPRHVENKEDPDANVPFVAHVQYWGGKLLGSVLYDAVK